MFKYNFQSLYKYLSPLFKHTVDIYRLVEVTDSNFLTHEERRQIAHDVECYMTQDIRAPYLAINNLDTLRISGYFVLHVKYDVDLQSGDYVEARVPGNEKHIIAHGYCGDVRIGTATRRAMINVDDTKEQDHKTP